MRTLLTLGLVATAVPLAAQQRDDFHWNGTVARGRTVEIIGVNGDIAITGGASGVEVSAVKRARRSDPADVKIEVVEHGTGVTICAIYSTPSDERPNECLPGGRGRNNSRNNDVQVDFTVRVPAGVHILAHTVNGEVEARGIDGNADAATVNGNVEVDAAGFVHANSVNGSIRATMGRADWTGELAFATVNGGLTLTLPAGANFEVSATTVNGAIESDFPISLQGRMTPRRLQGTVGTGGRTLKLSTVNGSMTLRRAP